MKRINFDSRALKALWYTLRPLLGPKSVCIFPVTCPDYARYHLEHSPWYKAVLKIGIRLLSCNPITALYNHYRSKHDQHERVP